MENRALHDAIFRLGSISADSAISNDCLLRKMATTLASGVGVEAAAVAVFENGIENAPTMIRSVGHWPDVDADRAGDETDPAAGERAVVAFVRQLGRDRFTSPEPTGDSTCRCDRLYSEFHRPMRLVDHALAVFHRADGVELVVVVSSASTGEPLGREILAHAASLAGLSAQCWASAWRREPAWMGALSPSSRRVLENLLEGCDDDQIAQRTGLTYHSVRAHLKRIFRDAGVRSRLHLIQQCRTGTRVTIVETVLSPQAQMPVVTVTARGNGVFARTG